MNDYENDETLFPKDNEARQLPETETPDQAQAIGGAEGERLTPAVAELEVILKGWLSRITNEVEATGDALTLAGNRFAISAKDHAEAAADLVKADLRGVMIEEMEEVGFQAGENIAKLIAQELGGFAEKIEQNTNNMLAATQKVHEAAARHGGIPSRFVWFTTGAVSFWLVTKYIDLARWAAIGEAVVKSFKGAV